MTLRPRPLLVAALLAACNDGVPVDSAGGTGTSSGSTTVASSTGQVPTTSPTTGPDASTGASDSMSGTTAAPTSGPTTATTAETATTAATTDGASSSGAVDSSSGGGSSGGSTGPGGCVGPEDCPAPATCREATCTAGACGEQQLPAGAPCPAGVCDAGGACVDCLADTDCPQGQVCLEATCAAPSCMDGKKNGGETDLDCGGPQCPKCDPGDACQQASDCGTGVCTGDVCQSASCTDVVKNGGETDVDCGGPACPKCQDGDACAVPGDCQSNDCQGGLCKAAPTCSDALKNGQETDVDCGGPTCPKCDPGESCQLASDCTTSVCTANVCKAATCTDAVKNGQETDVDCGGPTCPKCQIGKVCVVGSDCASNTCTAGKCVAAGPACASNPADPATGQRCPLFMSCTQSAECGVFQGCQQWFCNNAKTCELNALVDCGTTKGGGCNAGVVFVQHDDPPVDKRFLPPDNVNFREVASLAFTVYNYTANDLYLDKLPVQLELMGGGSKFDVSSAKIFDNTGGTEHGPGDILVCLTGDPFSFPANGVLGPCAGSAFSRVPKNGSQQFIVNLAFAKEKTFIAGRSYRLKLATTNGVIFKVGFNGPDYVGTMCGVPPEGYTGAWLTAQNP